MASGQREDHGEWTCPKCGNVYRIGCTRYPFKDKIDLDCDCGSPIFHGNSTHDYDKTFVRNGDPKDASKNPML